MRIDIVRDMDPSVKVFDELKKKELEKALVEKLIGALETKQIDMVQMKAASAYILDSISYIKNTTQLKYFLENLSKIWPLFLDVEKIFKYKYEKTDDTLVMDKLRGYINDNKN